MSSPEKTNLANFRKKTSLSKFALNKLFEHYKPKPYPKLESARLILRKPSKKDIPAYHQILSSPDTSRYSELPENPNEKRTKRFLVWMSKLHSSRSGIAWLICVRETGIVIGAIRLYKIDNKAFCGLLAYEIHPKYWNQGYASEALRKVVEFAHHDIKLNRLEAWSCVNNIASEHVLKKNGFILEGLLREKVSIRGELMDVQVFAHFANLNNEKNP